MSVLCVCKHQMMQCHALAHDVISQLILKFHTLPLLDVDFGMVVHRCPDLFNVREKRGGGEPGTQNHMSDITNAK